MKIAFLGLGRMGKGMAHLLVGAGYELKVFDVFPEASVSLVAAGAKAAPTVAEAVQGQDVVISMLPTDAILESLTRADLVTNMGKGAIHLMMGTHGIETVRKVTKLHTDAGQVFVAGHVLGRPDLAATGQLTIVAGGPAAEVASLQPIFDVLGKRTFVAGVEPQAASAVKIANNFVLGCAIETLGESMSLVRKLGVEPHMFLEVLLQGLFGAPAYQIYGKMIADEAYDSMGATAIIGLKDINLALQAAETAQMPLPSANVMRDRLLGAIAHGESALDWAVVAKEQARASGLIK